MGDVARLRDLMREVAEALEIDAPTDEDDEFSINYPFEDGRSKSVSAFVEDDEGDPWVMIFSVFGSLEDLDPVDLLARNFSPGYTFIGADEGDAMVMASYPLDDIDAESLEALVGDVASWAEALREEFAGEGE
ncbi:MAG: type III secretion system chaperone [Dehalococcoidia bacterium]